MAKPFKFRYVNEIVGIFVLLVVAALAGGVVLAGKYQEWLVPVHRLRIVFPPEGSLGLQVGAEVQILGTTVGRIEKILIDEDGKMLGKLTIKGDFIRFVRTDSVAKVKKKFGIAGDAFIEITKGTGDPIAEGFDLMIASDTELGEVAQELLDEIRKAVLPAIEKLQKAVDEYTALAADLRNPEGPLLKMLANVERITDGLQKGEGTAGKLLRDPATAEEVQKILKRVDESLGQVQGILADVKATTERLPSIAGKVDAGTDELDGLLTQTQDAIREAERLVQGLQSHWLIRKYIDRPEPTAVIPPSEVSPLKGGAGESP
jgi:phospholipid/cholesterol/gamma-HCH transport system substrate-binding protein